MVGRGDMLSISGPAGVTFMPGDEATPLRNSHWQTAVAFAPADCIGKRFPETTTVPEPLNFVLFASSSTTGKGHSAALTARLPWVGEAFPTLISRTPVTAPGKLSGMCHDFMSKRLSEARISMPIG